MVSMASDIGFVTHSGSLLFTRVSDKTAISDIYDGVLIDVGSDEAKARRIVDSLQGSSLIIAVQAGDNRFNRRVLETMRVSYLVDVEYVDKRDTLKQRDSGFNHVLAAIAHRRGISLVVSLHSLNGQSKQHQAIILSRVMQNITLCRKFDVGIKLASFAVAPKDFRSSLQRGHLFRSLGASSQQVRDCVLF